MRYINILFLFVHGGGDSKNHEYFLDVSDAHGVEIRNSITEGDPSEHVGRLDEGIEEIKSWDKGIRWNFYGRNVGRFYSYWFRQLGKVGKKLVLGYFTPSALHLCKVGQHEVSRQPVLSRIKRLQRRRLTISCCIFWEEHFGKRGQLCEGRPFAYHKYNKAPIKSYPLSLK